MTDSLAGLSTEQSDPRYREIDRLSTEQVARLMNAADATVPAAVAEAIPEIAAAIDAIVDRMKRGGRLIYVGAGTSGRLAVLDASECPPTFGTDPELVQGVIAGGEPALTRSVEGAEDDAPAGAAAMEERQVGALDSVVGVSASGRAAFVVGALREAARRDALTLALTCNAGTPIAAAARHPIEVVVGAEVVTGSTRLKAGTAQKLVLNMISTIAMIGLGRTYGNNMIEVSAANAKLADRATRMVSDITGSGLPAARSALESADWNVKVAVLMVEQGLDSEGARTLLAAHGDNLEAALAAEGVRGG
ncbi:N-acetylmuramic acid 6-phosphate etherase [Planobispora rosea]|uniref:N-acetylmuramic acid 6-phosphate etherase n=1 Tax=Planobispora rosea TaxID=35762 RepID=A0A8J3S0H8_PLARO|nr:N-acetylmuramic acid 6-phosphate etherase [Planobispora rosea]GGS83780.1 N-acetylmuramic acid 6-phosphate etherase [Planobispora rosea]GIH86306.1 N-acetylmuramic acid 6-phosphate etherase [Planobispora rosea]